MPFASLISRVIISMALLPLSVASLMAVALALVFIDQVKKLETAKNTIAKTDI